MTGYFEQYDGWLVQRLRRINIGIRGRVALGTLCGAVFILAVAVITLGVGMRRSILAMEADLLAVDAARVQHGIDAEVGEIVRLAIDWGEWDYTYRYVQGEDDNYVEDNLGGDATLEGINVHIFAVRDLEGRVLYSESRHAESWERADDPEAELERLCAAYPSLIRDADGRVPEEAVSGIVLHDGEIVAVASQPVLPNSRDGSVAGTLIMARRLTPFGMEALSERVQLPVHVRPLDSNNDNTVTSAIEIQPLGQDRIRVTEAVRDLNGRAVAMASLTKDRRVYQGGQAVLLWLVVKLLACGAVAFAILFTIVDRLVVSRLERLSEDCRAIGGRAQHQTHLRPDTAGDEISAVTNVINDMLDRLAATEEDLNQTRAEVAERQRAAATLMSNLPGIAYRCKVDKAWTMEFISEGVTKMTGWDPEDFIGNRRISFGQLIHPDDLERLEDEVDAALSEQRPYEVTYRIHHRDGRMRWIWERGEGVFDSQGKVLALEGFISDFTQLKHAEERLRYAASHDRLTDLPNRVMLHEQLAERMEAQLEGGPAFALLFLDFDGFKHINDSLGHSVGDGLLVGIANRLAHCLASTPYHRGEARDNIFRLGGDEFVLIVDAEDEVVAAAEAVASAVHTSADAPFHVEGHDVHVTASIGMVPVQGDYEVVHDVLRDADTAMYRAKQAGPGLTAAFDPEMHAEAIERLYLENQLRQAIAQEQLHLLYQPIVCMETGRLKAFEALIRWVHPERGFISPERFIPLAEESLLIVDIGRFVIETACRQLAEWNAQNPAAQDVYVAINLSRRELLQPRLVEDLLAATERHGIEHKQLRLEITESAVMDDLERALAVMDQLRGLGFELSLDDFGTGQSSLSCAHRFPISTLKLDRSFIASMSHNLTYTSVTKSIIELAHNLGARVVAEGIEDQDQLVQLQALECDFAQGYFFDRPLNPADAFERICAPEMGARAAG